MGISLPAIVLLGLFCCAAPASGGENNRSLTLAPYPSASIPRPVPAPAQPTRKDIQKAARSTYPQSHYQRGMYLRDKGESERALIEFLKASQENPKLVQAFYEQALIFRERGYLKLAESALEQALAVKADFKQASILLATVRLEQGNLGGAVSELSKSLGLKAPAQAAADPAVLPEPKGADSEGPAPSVMQTPHYMLAEPPPPAEPEPADRAQVQPFAAARPAAPAQTAVQPAASPEVPSAIRQVSPMDTGEPPGTVRKMTVTGPIELKSLLDPEPGLKVPNPFKFWRADPWSRGPEKIKPRSLAGGKKARKLSFLDRLFSLGPDGANQRAARADRPARRLPATAASDEAPLPMVIRQPSPVLSTPAPTAQPATAEAQPPPVPERQFPPLITEARPLEVDHLSQRAASAAEPAAAPILLTQPLATAGDWSRDAPAKTETLPARPAPATSRRTAPPEDDWTRKLRYLSEHGTATLKPGEAFMFSEETGEAVLFRPGEDAIRRQVAAPRDKSEVVHERRPDMTRPSKDMQYNLALRAKLVAQPPAKPAPPAAPPISLNQLNAKKEGPLEWLRGIMRF